MKEFKDLAKRVGEAGFLVKIERNEEKGRTVVKVIDPGPDDGIGIEVEESYCMTVGDALNTAIAYLFNQQEEAANTPGPLTYP